MIDGASLAVGVMPPPPVPGVGTRLGMSDMVEVGVAGTPVGVGVVAAATGAVVGAPVVTGTATGAPVAAATGAAVGADLHVTG